MVPNQAHLATMARRLTTSSAMNPSLMLCLMVTPLSLGFGAGLFYAHAAIPAAVFIVIACSPLGVALWQLVKFTNHDPDRLQRDEHNENMLQIKNGLMIKRGDVVTEVPVSGQLVGNPQIEDKSGE